MPAVLLRVRGVLHACVGLGAAVAIIMATAQLGAAPSEFSSLRSYFVSPHKEFRIVMPEQFCMNRKPGKISSKAEAVWDIEGRFLNCQGPAWALVISREFTEFRDHAAPVDAAGNALPDPRFAPDAAGETARRYRQKLVDQWAGRISEVQADKLSNGLVFQHFESWGVTGPREGFVNGWLALSHGRLFRVDASYGNKKFGFRDLAELLTTLGTIQDLGGPPQRPDEPDPYAVPPPDPIPARIEDDGLPRSSDALVCPPGTKPVAGPPRNGGKVCK